MFHRRPIALEQLPAHASLSIARLTGVEGFSRALLVGLAPLLAFQALGSKAAVSHTYLAASILTLMITLNMSNLERLMGRRWVVTLAGVFLIVAAGFVYSSDSVLFALGLGMRAAAASLFSVCLSLYIMEHIGKADLTRSESRRMVHAGIAWLVGPMLGMWLWQGAHPSLPFIGAAAAGAAMIGYFWYLRLGPNPVVSASRERPRNPLRAVVRYMRQRRLRIAYGITLSRSCFWVALFVFGPIYVVEAGQPPWMAALLLSGASGLLLLSPLVRRSADHFGSRQVIISGLGLTGLSMIALGLVGAPAPVGIVFWVTGSLGGVVLDVLGNIPFMRNVRPRDRSEMTMVFSTWREGSELLTPALAAVVALALPFWAFYVVLGVLHLGALAGALGLPRRL